MGESSNHKLVQENIFKKTVQILLKIIKNRKIPLSQLEETDNLNFLSNEEKEKISKINTSGDGSKVFANNGAYKAIYASDILETTDKKILEKEERDKIAKIITNGNGTKALTDDGTYKTPDSVGVVNDTIITEDMSYSSKKIEVMFDDLNTDIAKKLLQKSDLDHTHEELETAHSHDNKNVLDEINTTLFGKLRRLTEIIDPDKSGLGNKAFFDDLTFKEISVSGDAGTANPGNGEGLFHTVNKNDFVIQENTDEETQKLIKELSLHYHISVLTKAEYEGLQRSSSIDPNTLYIVSNGIDISDEALNN